MVFVQFHQNLDIDNFSINGFITTIYFKAITVIIIDTRLISIAKIKVNTLITKSGTVKTIINEIIGQFNYNDINIGSIIISTDFIVNNWIINITTTIITIIIETSKVMVIPRSITAIIIIVIHQSTLNFIIS